VNISPVQFPDSRKVALSAQDPLMRAFWHCQNGKTQLEALADARPIDFTFLEAADFVNLQSSGFARIEEWDAFATHSRSCPVCGEV
jgi:hypothetical protein